MVKMRNKYGAKKVEVNGEKFDSKLEHSRWCGLLVAEKAGLISELKRQVPFILAPSVKFYDEKRALPAMKYIADFTYVENGILVVEDAKGVQTPDFRIKRRLMITVHGIQIRLTGGRQ